MEKYKNRFNSSVEFKDCELREGERNSYDACNKRRVDRIGNNVEYCAGSKHTKTNIEATKSILTLPFLRAVDLDLLTADPLHIHEGMVTHLTENTIKLLATETASASSSFL